MGTRKTYQIILLVGVSIILMGQAAPKSKKQLMEESLQEKLATYVVLQEKRCTKKVMDRAQAIVDSILLREAQLKTIDTFDRPAKPRKPSQPAIKVAKDTTPVKPLFEN